VPRRAPLYRKSDYRRALAIELGKGTGHEPPWRSPFWRDRARLIHCAAFRRLQGKTQLFAGLESDFFRNRLTHSLEVAQIAATIARKLNVELEASRLQLDEDLIEFAGLAHDLGHPPFGHTGEAVLDQEMRRFGGFEGNAQTLRILCRLEKKLDDPNAQIAAGSPVWYRHDEDVAVGLNLCSRTLASILKYDTAIPFQRGPDDKLVKGYYLSELPVVERVKQDLAFDGSSQFWAVECQIMDLADDIAYSTYDLEDAFKGGLLLPLDMLYPNDAVASDVARRVSAELDQSVTVGDVRDVLKLLFFAAPPEAPAADWPDWYLREAGKTFNNARQLASIGFYRTFLTSTLVNQFIHAVELDLDRRRPAFSRVTMRRDERIQVSVLKQMSYVLLITSPRLRMVAHRGEQVVRSIFRALSAKGGEALLPADFYQRYQQASKMQRPRVICDFIAGMTDRYATEFYARLSSDVFTTMFKPL
jgi:dGTPase